jgi:phosphate transport system permease protein
MAKITGRYQRRLLVNRWNLAMSLMTMAFGMMFLLWILTTLFLRGFEALSPTLFTQMTPPPGSDGGLLNAIFGSFLMVLVATLISTPIGILRAYIWLNTARTVGSRTHPLINDILLSAPSIVIGLFVYTVYVARAQHYPWAGRVRFAAGDSVVRRPKLLRLVRTACGSRDRAGCAVWKSS